MHSIILYFFTVNCVAAVRILSCGYKLLHPLGVYTDLIISYKYNCLILICGSVVDYQKKTDESICKFLGCLLLVINPTPRERIHAVAGKSKIRRSQSYRVVFETYSEREGFAHQRGRIFVSRLELAINYIRLVVASAFSYAVCNKLIPDSSCPIWCIPLNIFSVCFAEGFFVPETY